LSGEALNITDTSMPISMQPGELLIYTDQKITDSIVDSNGHCIVYPTITKGKVYVSTTDTLKSISIYSIQGILVKTAVISPEVDITNLTNGFYIMEVNTSQGKNVFRIIKN
jgi:hypothetical protein